MAIPDKYKFKMLIELAQMISTLTGVGYKPIKQGKELVSWIDEHRHYTFFYFAWLFLWSKKNINMKPQTQKSLYIILKSLPPLSPKVPHMAYFRYKSGYECDVESKTLLPVDICIKEYEKYLNWKQ